MADITKCSGIGCPLKDTCYRFKALANPYGQSMFIHTPGKYVKPAGGNMEGVWECDYYVTYQRSDENDR